MNHDTEITTEDTFEAAIRLKSRGYNPVVLDFASATNPGGSWRSKQQGTQEESLCRRSDLGILLEKEHYPMSPNGAIYVATTITKDKNLQPIIPIKCGVIASELHGIASSKSQYLQKRICDIYDLAIKKNHNVIVLGSWGCGAFKETNEDLDILAKEFNFCLNKYNTKIKTVYAMYNRKNKTVFDKYIQTKY